MAKVPAEAKAVFENQRALPLATADKTGKPHVVMVAFWWWVDDENVAVVENFLRRTHDNLASTKWGCMVAYDQSTRRSFQIKCKAEYLTSGSLYDEAKRRVEEYRKKAPIELPARGVWKLKVEEIYLQTPGPDAGKKLA